MAGRILTALALLCACANQRAFAAQRTGPKRPHIIIIMADDLGWNDVSYHGSDQIPTPNIDALAFNGVILNNHYSQALCTPSRSALLTGRYPIHTGMQHRVILPSEPWGLPLKERLLSEDLRSLGYATHMVGKWHLGFHTLAYTPTRRGFDSHYGFWSGFQDYYTHQAEGASVAETILNQIFPSLMLKPFIGLDMRRNLDVDRSTVGRYSTDLFAEEAASIITAHSGNGANWKRPLFLYVALSAPHSANSQNPLQAPMDAIDKFRYIEDESRRKYAAMVWKLDEAVGKVVKTLEETAMLNDSIIVFLSDNGAQTTGIHWNRGSNYPFKGEKISPWEGGVRTCAFVWSPLIKSPGRISNQLFHISDWLPTLFSAAGGDVSQLRSSTRAPLDGVDMSAVIFGEADGLAALRPPVHTYHQRREVLINIDEADGYAALRVGNYKLVDGTTVFGLQDHWVGDSGKSSKGTPSYNVSALVSSAAGQALSRSAPGALIADKAQRLRRLATVNCDAQWPPKDLQGPKLFPPCKPILRPCLFDVAHDPCERRNLFDVLPEVAAALRKRLDQLKASAAPTNNRRSDPRADPRNWGGVWTNWNDYPRPRTPLSLFG
ncbi:arylsulfatase B-like isoform X1 [Ischnura elegans]|uniref:arylsulfatase B-like isoform X1 n=1 Tax=Ischnura elegans TaxID=197161 RepID=UPI001ED871C9|nr:arylsulfatase B-like isoform X1 [Ischnura elegans]